jgi:hypothetical protein
MRLPRFARNDIARWIPAFAGTTRGKRQIVSLCSQ